MSFNAALGNALKARGNVIDIQIVKMVVTKMDVQVSNINFLYKCSVSKYKGHVFPVFCSVLPSW